MRIRFKKDRPCAATPYQYMRLRLPMVSIAEPTRGERLIDQCLQALIKVCETGNTKAQRTQFAKSRKALVNYMKNVERGG